MNRSPLKRSTPLRRTPLARRSARKAPARFVADQPAREEACVVCGHQAQSWHHLLPAQSIRVYVRGLRLSEGASRALLRRLLADPRDLAATCLSCHMAHELHVRPLTASQVPDEARELAAELGAEWSERLNRHYPEATT